MFFVVLLSTTVAAADRIGDLLVDLRLVPLEGQPAPAWSLPGLDARSVSLAELKGHVVFLYFFATW